MTRLQRQQQQPPQKASRLRRFFHPTSNNTNTAPTTTNALCPRCIALITTYFAPVGPEDDPRDFSFYHGPPAFRAQNRSCPLCRLVQAVGSLAPGGEYVVGVRRKGTVLWAEQSFEFFRAGVVQVDEAGGRVLEEGYGMPPEEEEFGPGVRVMQFDVPSSTNSEQSFALARRWMRECGGEGHPNCRRENGGEATLPTRVLDVGHGMYQEVVLVETGGNTEGRYVTLSHRWEAALACKTTRANLDVHKRGIGFNALPATFREAVVVCRKLGIRYLWIDALCIVQDWDADWDREAARMAEVYANSVLTISALDSTSSHGGLFRNRTTGAGQSVTFPSPLPGDGGVTMMGVRVAAPTFGKEMEVSPLTSRGWVFQERVLSTATLHFGALQMSWECRSMVATERCGRVHDFMEALTYEFGRTMYLARKDGWKTMAEWRDVVGYFTRKRFTVPTDRLPAIMGVAKPFDSLAWSQRENVFIAGLWSGALAAQLLWSYDKADAHRTLGPPVLNLLWVPPGWKPRQPSWSWISVDYPVAFFTGQDAEALDWHVRVVGWDRDRMADLATYRDRPHEMELRLEGGLLRLPITAERLDRQVPVQRVLTMRYGQQVIELHITVDPGCSIPPGLLALRVSSFSGYGAVPGPRSTWFLLLQRVHHGINRFKRIGTGSGPKDAVDDAFRHLGNSQVVLV